MYKLDDLRSKNELHGRKFIEINHWPPKKCQACREDTIVEVAYPDDSIILETGFVYCTTCGAEQVYWFKNAINTSLTTK